MARSASKRPGKSGTAAGVAPLGQPRRGAEPAPMRPPTPLTRTVSLRWRVTLLAASVVAIAVAVTSIAAYAMVARALYGDVDAQLRARAATMISGDIDSMAFQSLGWRRCSPTTSASA